MLIEKERHDGIRRGDITVLFRRWRQRQATAGAVYRTALGRVAVDAVDVVEPAGITDSDAVAAGYGSAAEVVADLRGREADPVYRLAIRFVEEADPRDELAAADELSAADVADIAARLARLDRASSTGPWTEATLKVIERRPAVRAGDLAAEIGRDPAQFKLDVRKLKNLGLTISLGTGYRISPRGAAYLASA
ncbi:hypothetical protein [Amycolatopsis vastitatis]|uniref:ASCH domain-containing protein n=1 Tax=Amycolatopsis vastitatis TaxID=1905142 RepID=A0A229T3T6_9PSEU|nr:hypothetical protein [Amycolatopsis vastitatis]OXM65897.1 hypothetical protein CF165_21160 [Amycolatopsis vastitatis]